MSDTQTIDFASFNAGFARLFQPGRLSLGLMFPIEAYGHAHWDMPTMAGQVELAKRAEALGFAGLWVRDVPLRDPNFGDVGQIYDPWVWLATITAATREIALGTGSIILPLRHPFHIAKAAASIDQLSGGRLVMGVGSGDRPVEFPAFDVPFQDRGEIFRESIALIRASLGEEYPDIRSSLGTLRHADVIPKPHGNAIPMLVTGGSQQELDWTAEHSDGWLTYGQHPTRQRLVIEQWRAKVAACSPDRPKPFAQGLHVDLAEDPEEAPTLIHNGYRLGRARLIELFDSLQHIGVNHCLLNFKFAPRPAAEIVEEIAAEVLPRFSSP